MKYQNHLSQSHRQLSRPWGDTRAIGALGVSLLARAIVALAACIGVWLASPAAAFAQVPSRTDNVQSSSLPQSAWTRVIARATGRTAADLYLDGTLLCRMPCQVMVPPGQHRFVTKRQDGTAVEQVVNLQPGATVPVLLDTTVQRARLQISSSTHGTAIYVDGTFVAYGNWQGHVQPGPHQLALRRPNGENLQQAITVDPGRDYTIRDNAQPQPPAPARSAPVQPGVAPVPQRPPASVPVSTKASPAPPVAPQGTPDTANRPTTRDSRTTGITGALFVPMILGGPSTSGYRQDCPADSFYGTCSASGPRGAAIAGRIGYSFGWIAPEAMVALSVDVASAGLHLPDNVKIPGDPDGLLTTIVGDTRFARVGIMGGAGARLTSGGDSLRFTLSGTLGLLKHHVYVIPDSFFGDKPSFTAETIFLDGGILIGETPGLKVYVGMFLWFEFQPTVVVKRDVTRLNLTPSEVPASMQSITALHGLQTTFGPLLGVVMGH